MNKSEEQIKVSEMMKLYEQRVEEHPVVPCHQTINRCFHLISEEVNELYASMIKMASLTELDIVEGKHDFDVLVEVADAIGDVIVTLHGLSNACGLPMKDVFNEIHRSNMSKANPGGTLTKDKNGKLVKPSTYSPADLKTILENAYNV